MERLRTLNSRLNPLKKRRVLLKLRFMIHSVQSQVILAQLRFVESHRYKVGKDL